MDKVHILGMGSPFGDDRAGWSVIECLQQEIILQPFISKSLLLDICDRPYSNLLELLSHDEATIIIDAMKMGVEIGSWREVTINEIAISSNCLSTHGLGVIEALRFAELYKKLPKQLKIYGIEIDNIKGFDVSSQVNNGIINLSQHLCKLFYQQQQLQ